MQGNLRSTIERIQGERLFLRFSWVDTDRNPDGVFLDSDTDINSDIMVRRTLICIFISDFKLTCPCGYFVRINMSDGAEQGQRFDELVNRSIELNNLKVHDVNKMLKQMNMGGKNCNGTTVGIDLENVRMSNMRKQLHCEIISKRVELEDQMLKRVLESTDIPSFSYDGFYTDR